MVDRPIKKADRQNPPVESDGTPKSSEAPSKKSSSSRGGEKGGGRRDSNKREESKPPENLALMRGPKPSKAKPPTLKEAEPEVMQETATEETSAEVTTPDEA
ncbi:hypothetical protein [Chamaesiphon sp. VAR_48_metabat_403]|uniref:hypothetical protein n=1 Tax=Chamaesiphon sp. VAR_48_metabat_403 TaxID=2964700 RepID=UPI00286E59E6|nr:hypothetical protein [Chamaesiphon sp. VAR_48_metabat_403]